MIVHEAPTPDGELVKKSNYREYAISGREFKYRAPSCEIVTFENATALSGSWEHGLAGVVKDGKFYHERFTKDANNFRTKSPFWSNARGEFKIDLEYIHQMNSKVVEECFTWFNISQYWHWFLEDLPLIEAFRKKECVIFTNVLTQWQLDSLDFFPDIKKRVVQLDTPISINCKKIHVATYPAISYRGKAATWAVEFLRDNLVGKEIDGPKRIYLSRNDAVARNVKNEAEVIDMLVNEYNFFPMNTHKENSMAGMSLQEKLNMFATADVVVSPTGAGLTHTHAMKPGSTVIDFNHSFEVGEECGWNNIAIPCDLNWHTFEAETLDMPEERPKPKNSHMRVDLNKLRDVLDNALSKAA
jgi:hypothetical protein